MGQDNVELVAVATDEGDSEEYICAGRGGLVIIPGGSSITSLTYYTAEKQGGTRVPLNDKDGAAVAQTGLSDGNAYDMPAEVYGCRVLYLKGNAAGPVFVTSRN